MPRRSRLRDPREAALHDTEWQARFDEVLAQLATRPWFGHWPVGYVDSPYAEAPRGSWAGVAAWPGLSRDDTLSDGEGNDPMLGAGGAERLSGLSGKDLLLGGQDDDTLVGGEGSDTYRFGGAGGHDKIDNADADGESHDVPRLGSGIGLDHLSQQHLGDELVIGILGSEDVITVTGWHVDPANRQDCIRWASGDVLTARQIENLVATMVALAPRDSGETGFGIAGATHMLRVRQFVSTDPSL